MLKFHRTEVFLNYVHENSFWDESKNLMGNGKNNIVTKYH